MPRGDKANWKCTLTEHFKSNAKCSKTILSTTSVVKGVIKLKVVHQKGSTIPLSKCTLLLALEGHKIHFNKLY